MHAFFFIMGLFIFTFQKCFLKNLNFILFFSWFQINIYFVFSNYFNVLMSKNNFLKIKKNIIFIYFYKKHFKTLIVLSSSFSLFFFDKSNKFFIMYQCNYKNETSIVRELLFYHLS